MKVQGGAYLLDTFLFTLLSALPLNNQHDFNVWDENQRKT